MSPPYLPIYGIYVPSLTKTFMYHLKTLFKSFLFVTVQAHGAVRGNQYLSCQKYLTVVLTSQKQKEKREKEKSCTSPILDDDTTVYDRWSQEQKCKQKNNKKIWLAWKILRDLYRSPLTGKLHSQKKFISVLKLRA